MDFFFYQKNKYIPAFLHGVDDHGSPQLSIICRSKQSLQLLAVPFLTLLTSVLACVCQILKFIFLHYASQKNSAVFFLFLNTSVLFCFSLFLIALSMLFSTSVEPHSSIEPLFSCFKFLLHL